MNDLTALRRGLLRWFSRAKRPLPWRATRDPYAIWISESMLQQTTVATVIPYFERFLRRFPDVASLAASNEQDVLALWSGLGYYSRARNLRRAARQLVEEYGGLFPKDPDAARTLAGVGRYTASAVTSIAYGARVAVVDGNVRRVLSRLNAARGLSDQEVQHRADALLSKRSPGRWNEAMMELGATVCTPRKPDCPHCPIAVHCRGRARPEHWSAGKPRRKGVAVVMEMALVERRGRILLCRNPEGGRMGGLFDLPNTGLPLEAGSAGSLRQRFKGRLEILGPPLARIRHAVTHHRIEALVYPARLRAGATLEDARFHTLEAAIALPLGGLTRKALRATGYF